MRMLALAAMLAAAIVGYGPTQAINAEVISPEYAQSLIDAGYHGQQGDNSETIYAPRNIAISMCLTDTDCEEASR